MFIILHVNANIKKKIIHIIVPELKDFQMRNHAADVSDVWEGVVEVSERKSVIIENALVSQNVDVNGLGIIKDVNIFSSF